MGNIATRLEVETVRTLAFGAIGAGYVALGAIFDHPAAILHFQNHMDSMLMFSYDGVNDHFPLAANGFLLLDVTANKGTDNGLYWPAGTTIYVRQVVAPTTGSVYLTVYYT